MRENQVIQGDCLEVMKDIPDKSIDMILCDLPYGTTACKWDTIIPFEPLWEQYKRIIKDNGAIVLTASQPFTTDVINSNRDLFRYEIIWERTLSGNPFLVKKQPLKVHENVLVFYKKFGIYNPQMTLGKMRNKKITGAFREIKAVDNVTDQYYPRSVQYFDNADRKNKVHPTQKPVVLFEYLIKTYTNEGDLVLDNCAGSGTTGVACKKTGRNYILIEKEEKYCKIARQRLRQEILL
jgi:site-specific DNA-methyltransferase (adenine-specific)